MKTKPQVTLSKQNRKIRGIKKTPKKLKKPNCIWLMQQNISDSLADWREERLKIEVGRRDGRGNREYTFYICHGLWLGWCVRKFGLWLQQGALSFSCEISSLPSSFCKGKGLSLLFSYWLSKYQFGNLPLFGVPSCCFHRSEKRKKHHCQTRKRWAKTWK